MAMRRMLATCVILVTCTMAGCGTVANLSDHPWISGGPGTEVYGGVGFDFSVASSALSTPIAALKSERTDYSVALAPLVLTCAVLDLPLSIIGDTLTLPLAQKAIDDYHRRYDDRRRYSDHPSRPPHPTDLDGKEASPAEEAKESKPAPENREGAVPR